MQTNTRTKQIVRLAAGIGAVLGASLSMKAAEPAAKAALPAWITELSVSAKESYDDNVYGSEEVLQAGYPDLVKKSSWVTTVGARFFFSASALQGSNKDLLLLGYAPTYNYYSGRSDENNTQHRFSIQSKGRIDAWSWNLDNAATYVAGSRSSLRYTGYSAFGIGLPRERRRQWQDSGKFSVKYDVGEYFGRLAGAVTYYDLLTDHHVTTGEYAGWLNFVDRHDVNGGIDVGWNYSKDIALYAGWRTGHQYQQSFTWVPSLAYNSSSNYNRALVGFEGKPLSWLSVNLVGGPDFRSYTAPVDRRGISHKNQTALYLEASASATYKDETFTLTGKHWRWVSSTGRVAYDDKNWQLAWKHKFSAAFSAQLSTQFQQGQYANYPTAISTTGRNDVLYTEAAQIQWNVSKKLVVTADYTWQRAENAIDGGATAGREYKRQMVGLGAKYTF